MAKEFILSIYTPTEIIFEGNIEIITLKIDDGYIGIMADRIPLISNIKPGIITLGKKNKKEYIIGNGILRTTKDRVTISTTLIRPRSQKVDQSIIQELNKKYTKETNKTFKLNFETELEYCRLK